MSNKRKESASVDFIRNPLFTDDSNCEIFKALECQAHTAINSKKVFSIVGDFEIIRQSLLTRGWIEKILDIPACKIPIDEKMIRETKTDIGKARFVLSQLVKSSPIYFIWHPKNYGIPLNINFPLRNRINRLRTSDFTLKEGLHNITENIQWHIIENISELNYPRSFLLMDLYQRDNFLHEFRRTMITSFIFFLNDCEKFESLFSEDAMIPVDLIYQSINALQLNIKLKQNLCIDLETTPSISTFNDLAKQIDLVVNQRKKIKYPEHTNSFIMEKLKANVRITVAEIHVYWPESKYDGYRNIWILKPINKSRGYGVVLMRDVEKIFEHVVRHTENKYIVQKYCGESYLSGYL